MSKVDQRPRTAEERAAAELDGLESLIEAQRRNPGVDSKRLRAGATEALATSMPNDVEMEVKNILTSEIRIPDGYLRVPGEYEDEAFESLRASILLTGGNVEPIDVRRLDVLEANRAGVQYELISGTRRYRACKDLGRPVVAKVRTGIDRRTSHRLHELENGKRTNKSPVSQGRWYSFLMGSGEYQSQSDLAEYLGVDQGNLNLAIRLVDDAPLNFWAKIRDPEKVSYAVARKLVKAFKIEAFVRLANECKEIDSSRLPLMIRQATRPAPTPGARARSDSSVPTLQRTGRAFVLQLPLDTSPSIIDEINRLLKAKIKPKAPSS